MHEAWDPLLQRRVALKVLHVATPEQLLRLFREAQAQARLDHPNICRILELGNQATNPYIVMQLIQGPSLGDLRPDLSHQELARILAEVADAVHAAHLSGLVHRDLKPQNILVETLPDGTRKPFVVDFGLARTLDFQDQTLSWAVAGTPAFMSPEQAKGEAPTVASDIFGLGATLYALLSGTPPFEAATVAGLLTEQSRRDATPIRRALPQVPRDLETLALKCVEVDPARRYPTAFALAEELRRFLAGEPIQARPIRRANRLWRRVRRNPALSWTIAGSLTVLLVMLGWELHTSRLAGHRVATAQKLGMEARDIENLLRVERMLPPHDIRPAQALVRRRMEGIRSLMRGLGREGDAAGWYALGRGHLALREFDEAVSCLEQAWGAGADMPELAYSLGVAHAELLDRELRKLQFQPVGPAWEEARAALNAKHRGRALDMLRRSAPGVLEPAGLGQARLAYLEEDYGAGIAHVRRTLEQHPSCYEALVLEAQGALQQARRLWSLGRPPEDVEAMERQAVVALEGAQALGRSDVALHRLRLTLLSQRAMLISERGRPDLDLFAEADRLFAEAQVIQPDDPLLLVERVNLRQREGFVRLMRGEDARSFLEATLAMLQADAHTKGNGKVLLWMKGEAQWRRGVDPRPTLEAALAQPGDPGADAAEALTVLARAEAQRGLDPTARLLQAERILAPQMAREPGFYYTRTLLGEACLAQAWAAWWAGRDPRPSLAKGRDHLEAAVRLQGSSAYPLFHLPLVLGMEARLALARGERPMALIQAAVTHARQALVLRHDHFRSHLALAEAKHVEGLCRKASGQEAGGAFREARASLEEAQRHNPTDWRIALAQARLALEVGDAAGAERAAARGIAVKADAPELWWVRGLAARARKDGQAETYRATAQRLCPNLAPLG